MKQFHQRTDKELEAKGLEQRGKGSGLKNVKKFLFKLRNTVVSLK
jgi:sensor histidine kinase YesM